MKILNINLLFSLFSVIFILFLNAGCNCQSMFLSDAGLINLLQSLNTDTFINKNQKVVLFKLKHQNKKKYNYEMKMNYLREYLKSNGVHCDLYNWGNRNLVAVTRIDSEINREDLLYRFRDVVTDISENLAGEMLKVFKQNEDL